VAALTSGYAAVAMDFFAVCSGLVGFSAFHVWGYKPDEDVKKTGEKFYHWFMGVMAVLIVLQLVAFLWDEAVLKFVNAVIIYPYNLVGGFPYQLKETWVTSSGFFGALGAIIMIAFKVTVALVTLGTIGYVLWQSEQKPLRFAAIALLLVSMGTTFAVTNSQVPYLPPLREERVLWHVRHHAHHAEPESATEPVYNQSSELVPVAFPQRM
jgi:hypothetical protein